MPSDVTDQFIDAASQYLESPQCSLNEVDPADQSIDSASQSLAPFQIALALSDHRIQKSAAKQP
jgi:hypothetical protein